MEYKPWKFRKNLKCRKFNSAVSWYHLAINNKIKRKYHEIIFTRWEMSLQMIRLRTLISINTIKTKFLIVSR